MEEQVTRAIYLVGTPFPVCPAYPLFRVTTFSRFSLARLISSSENDEVPLYEPVAERMWRSRSAARSLFKLLLCRACRRAPKEVLIETLWPDVEEASAQHRFDS
ncbi:MAG TPA: hypothetical protein DHW02_14775, partial [Ktedonobacter sp.]|nr:hypothetical protein [Ktedonobacter sp.]